MISQSRENAFFCRVHPEVVAATFGHVAINAIVGQRVFQFGVHPTVDLLMALQASLGKQRDISAFELMRVMARGACHFRLGKTARHLHSDCLVAGMDGVAGLRFGDRVMVL